MLCQTGVIALPLLALRHLHLPPFDEKCVAFEKKMDFFHLYFSYKTKKTAPILNVTKVFLKLNQVTGKQFSLFCLASTRETDWIVSAFEGFVSCPSENNWPRDESIHLDTRMSGQLGKRSWPFIQILQPILSLKPLTHSCGD